MTTLILSDDRTLAKATPRFDTDFRYADRQGKARYVWLKYQSILTGRILDVGADQCHLRTHLAAGTEYRGIGLGDGVDQSVDLDKEPIPFADGSFDCVLCLDVLEHLDSIHQAFDSLCRVTRQYVIVSLPNPFQSFVRVLRDGAYKEGQRLKFYGLPADRPIDRHKWFFSHNDAVDFIRERAAMNALRVVQIDCEGFDSSLAAWLRRAWAGAGAAPCGLDENDLCAGTVWAVLEKGDAHAVADGGRTP
jgi:hypothetical protein